MSDWGDDDTGATSTAPVANGTALSGGDSWEPMDTAGDGGGWGSGTGESKPLGGGGSRACFKCNQVGHMSRFCPSGGEGGRGGGAGGLRACFKCGQEGHMSRDCPTGGGRGERKRGCFNCGDDGHMSKDCIQPKRERGAFSSNGASSGGGFDWGTDNTSSAANNSTGFDWGRDSAAGGGGGERKRGCFNCGGDGHMSRDCPEPKKEREGGGGTCRRCNKEGHFAKDCTALAEDGKPKAPIYIPQDLDETAEDFFDTIQAGINFDKYENIQVHVSGYKDGEEPHKPIQTFKDILTSETLLNGIARSKFTKPTPVQKNAIPILMNGRDLMACAQTGSGKTLAFLLPMLQKFFTYANDMPSGYGEPTQKPYGLVITPTRELAIQIYSEAYKFTMGSIIKPQIIYGGTSVGHQKGKLSGGCHLLVATPGRLKDFIDKGVIGLSNIKFLVLDEADRMIDQGFIPDIRYIFSRPDMPEKGQKQMLMFSATFPDEVQRLAREFLADSYIFLTIGIVGGANSDVTQTILPVTKFEKRKKLTELLGSSQIKDRTMIFVEQKKTADFLASFLSQNNYMATSIHGDRFQSQREEALRDFRTGKMPILVATSVASRGLDIKDVRHVINYDMPKEVDDYVHRIGRTGRVGNLGKATTFFDAESNQDRDIAPHLTRILKDAGQEVPEFLEAYASGAGGIGGFDSNGFGGADVRGGPVQEVEDNWD